MTTELRGFRAAIVALTLLTAAGSAVPASAQYYGGDHTIRFHGGLFEPDGESEYWEDAEAIFTGDASEFEDAILGFDYRMGLGDGQRLGLLLSVSGFEGQDDREDLRFVDSQGFPIIHEATLEVTALTAGVTFNFAPRAAVQPYVGVGGGYYLWDLEESGDFVFQGPEFDEIFTATFQDDGATLGYFWLAGVEVPVGPSWSLFAEGRWHRAEDDLGGPDFEGFGDLDLSGRAISGGVSWTF
ncbi:MAG: outer membrane protein [Thermoanaerobaculia bacterium]